MIHPAFPTRFSHPQLGWQPAPKPTVPGRMPPPDTVFYAITRDAAHRLHLYVYSEKTGATYDRPCTNRDRLLGYVLAFANQNQ